jgi:ribosomal protein S18 acetylase RimI-like enzyme
MTLSYRTNTATVDQLADHLRRCDDGFIPPLHDRVVIDEYAQKIAELAVRFEAWIDGELVALVAAYLPARRDGALFITDVSVVPERRGRRLAAVLLDTCAAFARDHAVDRLRLEVDPRNARAIRLYQANGFRSVGQTGDALTMERAAEAARLVG